MNVEIPFEASTGPTTLVVTVGGVQSAPFNITLNSVSPYFDTQSGTGSGLAAVYDSAAGSALVTAAAPAHTGDAVFGYAVGLGATSPATATGLATATNTLPTLPTVTVGGVAATVAFAGIPKGNAGLYQVNFTIPSGVSGTVPLVISVGGVSSTMVAASTDTAVTIAVIGGTVTPTVTGVQNAVSYGTTLCPGLQAIVYGTGFGSTAANVSFVVGGKPGYVINATPNQLLVELPFEASTGATTMTVTVGGVASAPLSITLSAVSPAFLLQAPPTGAPTPPAGTGLADVIETSTNTPVTPTAPAHDGDNLYAYAVGLGPTNPPTLTGPVTTPNQTATLPTVTVGGAAAKVSSAGTTQYVGVYQVNFTVPANVQGTQPLVITIDGVSSSTMVTLATPGVSYIENNASFASAGTVSPGSIASVFANSLGVATNDLSIFPATTDKGVQVTFNGTAAPLFHVIGAPSPGNPQQIDLVVPTNLPTTGTANIQLTTSSAFYGNFPVNMVPSNPAFYRITDSAATPPLVNVIAQFANTAWLALPVSTTSNIGLPACTSTTNVLSECGRPATIGDTLVLYATGLGLATPGGSPTGAPLANGQVPPADGSVLYETPTTPVVTIGGVPAKVLFSGLAPGYPGEYQVDVTVPTGVASGDNVPVVLTILGASDSSTTISIQPRPSS
jgi:uncharacterized protein (TIGR03437 family)